MKMKKLPRIIKNNKKKSHQSFKRCPMGGYCFNPLCIFGCIEDTFKPLTNISTNKPS